MNKLFALALAVFIVGTGLCGLVWIIVMVVKITG